MIEGNAMGVVVHGGKVTIAVRLGGEIGEPISLSYVNEDKAAADILGHVVALRITSDRDRPVIFVFASDEAALLRDRIQIRSAEAPVRVELVFPTGRPASTIEGQVEFKNWWSELLYRLHEARARLDLEVPETYHKHVAAFGEVTDDNGKATYLLPAVVKSQLGALPVEAIAAIIASQAAFVGGTGRTLNGGDWDPYDDGRE